MKVVQINAVCGTGSTGRICVDLCEALIAEGHECKILFGNGSSDYKHGISVSNKWLVKLNALRARITGNDMGGCYISTFRIIRFLKQYKPDIVHLHNLHAHYVNLTILCRYLAKHDIPTVITLHDCWFFTGGCTHYTSAGCYRWQQNCQNCPGYNNGIESWFFNRARNLFSAKQKAILSIQNLKIIGVSNWISQEARLVFPQNIHIQTIHNGVNITQFYPERTSFREEHGCESLVLIMGYANKWLSKANTELLSNFLKLNRSDIKLVLVGCSESQMNYLNNFKNKIIAFPYVHDTSTLRKIYSACDLLYNCSREDTLPTVNLEAQACGTPVIAHNLTGIPETCCPTTSKIIDCNVFNDGNFIKKKQNTVIENRRWIEENFSKECFTSNHLDMYVSLNDRRNT